MKVIVSTAVSADGYLDDRSPDRLILSTPEDWACLLYTSDAADE